MDKEEDVVEEEAVKEEVPEEEVVEEEVVEEEVVEDMLKGMLCWETNTNQNSLWPSAPARPNLLRIETLL